MLDETKQPIEGKTGGRSVKVLDREFATSKVQACEDGNRERN